MGVETGGVLVRCSWPRKDSALPLCKVHLELLGGMAFASCQTESSLKQPPETF